MQEPLNSNKSLPPKDLDSPTSNKFPFFIGGLIVLILVGGIGYAALNSNFFAPEDKISQFEQRYAAAQKSHRSGNIAQAIEEFRATQTAAVNPNEWALATLPLAHNLFLRDSGKDRVEAVGLYKTIIDNEDIDVGLRATALSELAFASQLLLNMNPEAAEEFLKQNLFTDSFARYLDVESNSIRIGIRNLYAASDTLAPNVFAKFGIISFYTSSYFSGDTELDTEETANVLGELLAAASPALREVEREYAPDKVGEMYLTQALALSVIDRITDTVPIDTIENAFRNAVVAAKEGKSAEAKSEEVIDRLFYAMFLSNRFEKGREADITDILEPLGASQGTENPLVKELVSNAAQAPDTSLLKQSLRKLAERDISPELTEFLQANGWSL